MALSLWTCQSQTKNHECLGRHEQGLHTVGLDSLMMQSHRVLTHAVIPVGTICVAYVDVDEPCNSQGEQLVRRQGALRSTRIFRRLSIVPDH